jgi:hypothetical protein
MGGSSSTTNSTQWSDFNTNTSPWAPQTDYILNAFKAAQGNYDSMRANPYTGQYQAGSTQQQRDAYGNAITQAQNQQSAVDGMIAQGQRNAAMGWDAANSATGALARFGNTDQTANNISAAQRYASGFDTDGQVKAAMQAANRNAAEGGIPSLYRSSAAAGGLNSDRAALAQGVVERGLAETAGNLYAQLNNSNYQNGLNLAQGDNGRTLQALTAAGQLGAGIGQAGVNEQTGAINTQGALNNQAQSAANGLQGLNQLDLSANLKNYLGKYQMQNDALSSLWNIIGARSWGGNQHTTGINVGNSTTTQNPSILSTIGAGIGSVGSLLGL